MMLNGKVALITGASRGIGEAIALELAREGADVIVNYQKDGTGAEKVVKKIKEMGRKSSSIQANVSDQNEVSKMMEIVKKEYGKLDLLVNNAGITRDRTVKNMTDEEWSSVLNANLTGTFQVSKAALSIMPDGASIVNVSSVVGISGNFGQANYSASKAGVIGLTKSLSKECAKRKIRVNAIAPGFIETDMTKKIPLISRMLIKKLIALGRMGEPSEIAPVVAFLLSEKSSYITGQVIKIDGGMMF